MHRFILLLLCVAWPISVTAASFLSEETAVVDVKRLETLSKRWGVEAADMQHYQEIMKGPSLLWYKDLDPVWVLGIMSQSGSERMRFAHIVLERERGRAEKELAFQRAYDSARAKRYPNDTLLDKTRLLAYQSAKSFKRNSVKSRQALPSNNDQLVWFVRLSCPSCRQDFQSIRSKYAAKKLDIYFLDAANDQDINKWAASLNLDPALVLSKRVTLNYDDNAALCKQAKCQPAKSSQLYWSTSGLLIPVEPTSR